MISSYLFSFLIVTTSFEYGTCKNKKCEIKWCSKLKRLVSHWKKCETSGVSDKLCDDVRRKLKELAERERNWDETVTTNEEIKYDMSENRKGKATASYDVMYVHITQS